MDDRVEVVVETPRNSRNVYEVDDDGHIWFDRRLPGAFAYPADYGYVVGATGSDGEALDALVLMAEATYPGVRVRARVVGLFWIATGHGREAKLVCVPDGDPTYRGITELAQLPEHQRLEIAHFFNIYRDLDPDKDVRCDGQADAATAIAILQASR